MLHWLSEGDFPQKYALIIAPFALRIAEASSIAHLDKVEHGYENMDHYNIEFKKEGKALRSIDFVQGRVGDGGNLPFTAPTCSNLTFISLPILSTDDEDEDGEDEDGEAGAEEGEGAQTVSGGSAVTAASGQPSAPQQMNPPPSAARNAAST